MKILFVAIALVLCACSAPAPVAEKPVVSPEPQPAVSTLIPVVPTKCTYRGLMPDLTCSPGLADPRVTQANISSTICKSGYTATVRPPTSYTNRLKRLLMIAYGDVNDAGALLPLSDFEMDHIISLEIGGHPTDVRNFYPEHGLHNDKDKLENRMNDHVCALQISLIDAQTEISTDWVSLYIAEFNAEPLN